MRRRPLAAVALFLAVACAPGTPAATTTFAPPTTTASPAAADLDRLLVDLERYHPDPFHGIDRDEFVAALEDLKGRIDSLTPEQSFVEMLRVWALLAREGREGHQLVLPVEEGPVLPIRIFDFDDGVFVTDALDPRLAGAELTHVAGIPIDEALAMVEPLATRDSRFTVPGFLPWLLLRADVLEGLGIIDTDAEVELTVDRDGVAETVTVATIPHDEHHDWAGQFGLVHLPAGKDHPFLDDERLLWSEMVDDRTVYIRHRQMGPLFTTAVEDVEAMLDGPDVERIVLDLRHNPGGDNGLYAPVFRMLSEVDHPLTVLTDRHTFSAAVNLATELEQLLGARFAGEPTGGSPNLYGDAHFVPMAQLPMPLQVGVSTRYWQKSTPDDPRLAIEPPPGLSFPWTSTDYFDGRDPTLEAVLAGD